MHFKNLPTFFALFNEKRSKYHRRTEVNFAAAASLSKSSPFLSTGSRSVKESAAAPLLVPCSQCASTPVVLCWPQSRPHSSPLAPVPSRNQRQHHWWSPSRNVHPRLLFSAGLKVVPIPLHWLPFRQGISGNTIVGPLLAMCSQVSSSLSGLTQCVCGESSKVLALVPLGQGKVKDDWIVVRLVLVTAHRRVDEHRPLVGPHAVTCPQMLCYVMKNFNRQNSHPWSPRLKAS